ncbi:MAG: hypothetical protein QM504_02185 [Pseudomonadota bacterium]
MNNSGAKAALRGYRLQTLYTLVEILNSKDSNIVFQPEGKEDLAIHKKNKLTRVIQVKARSEKLSLSHFHPEKKDSFFHRVSDLLCDDSELSIEVISFGEIGSEIKKAWSGDISSQASITKKLIKYGIYEQKVECLFKQIKWSIVSEQELYDKLKNYLTSTMVSGNPDSAFSLLMAWLYYASEHQEKISKSDLINKIGAVGKYLSERAAHHKEWFISITPLIQNVQLAQKEYLANEFYKGISSRFSHIQAGLDMPRVEQINEIDKAFQSGHKTVIVHGASGQGKTTLAYRYLYDFVPEDWRFQINFIENKSHARTIALAIADHLLVFNAYLYLYIDVSPNDLEWTSLVKSLLDQPNIKILVTIREEDLARQNISNLELGFPEGVPLFLKKVEAKIIYQNLIDKKVANPYPSFSDAWNRFGGDGALMEYVYFLTQTDSLKEKLSFQVNRLREEIRQNKLEPAALEILFCCAVATAFESRVQISALVKQIYLSDAAGTFKLFEDEYLIRCSNDKQHVISLHPLRSKLLVEVLSDPAFNPWIGAATKILPCILETDLESFLLYAFAEYPQEYPTIYQKSATITFHSWQGYAGVSRALIWYGIYSYVETNKKVIQQARDMAGNKGWKLLLNPDLVNISEGDPSKFLLETLGKNNPDKVKQAKYIRNQVSSPDIVFIELINWLGIPQLAISKPINEVDWLGMSEILFWIGWLKLPARYDTQWLLEKQTVAKISTISSLSQLTLSLYHYDKYLYHKFIKNNELAIKHLFQIQTNTLWLEIKPDNPIAHYIVPINLNNEDETISTSLNKQVVFRAEILRKLFPEAKKFGAKGYGHHIPFIELPFDEANKPGILKSSLPSRLLVNINSTYANLSDYNYRPDNWKIYAENIMSTRRQIVDGYTCLNKALIAYFKQQKPHPLIGWKINEIFWDKLSKVNMVASILPKLAVDPWGYTSEAINNNSEHTDSSSLTPISASIMLSEYKDYLIVWDEYLNSIISFINQSGTILAVNGINGRSPEFLHDSIFQKAEEIGRPYSTEEIHLSVVNLNNALFGLKDFQNAFRNKFYDLVDKSELKKLEEKETTKLKKSWSLWYQFAYHPDRYWKVAPEVRAMALTKKAYIDLLNTIKKVLANSATSKWQAKLLSESYSYDEKPALWLSLELQNISALETALAELVNSLAKSIRPIEYKDLIYFILTNHWHQIVIIPMLQGKTLSHMSWRILTSDFVGNEPVLSDDGLIKNIPQPLSDIAISNFKFEQCEIYNSDKINNLANELGEMLGVVIHFSNFIEVLPNLNKTGEKILTEYLEESYEKLTENISNADTIILELKNTIKNDDTYRLEVLEICEKSIYPYGKPEDNKMLIELGDCKDWVTLLQHALEALQLIKWINI